MSSARGKELETKPREASRMTEYGSVRATQHFNEIATKANAAAYQIHKRLGNPAVAASDAFKRGVEGGIDVCQFLSKSLGAALARPIEFHHLGLLALLKPVRQDLEEIGKDGLERLKVEAEETTGFLQGVLAKPTGDFDPSQAAAAQTFFRKIRDPFMNAATSLLLQDRS